MNAPAKKKLSELGKDWSGAPGWAQAIPRIVTGATLAPHGAQSKDAIEKPVDLGREFRHQYEIWRRDHPVQDILPSLPPIEETKLDMMRGARVVLVVGGAALGAFYLVGVLPNLNIGGFQPAPQAVPAPMKLASAEKTARLDVPPMPVAPMTAAPKVETSPWPQPPAPEVKSAAASAEPALKPALTLTPEEIELMRKRGEGFIGTGDLASARLVLERAAKAHDARAAFALAGTYDPAVLEQLQVYGAAGDIELAIMWYERAKLYGSKDAGQRLVALLSR